METIVKITLNENKPPMNKLADAEVHFRGGDLDGMKLVGFAVWRGRGRAGSDVTVPSREYTVEGRRRRYALLRPVGDPSAQDRIREAVIHAYEVCEEASKDAVQ